VQPLRVPAWETIPHLVHGFYGRRGGLSRGDFAELNVSDHVGDAPEAVRDNWRRVTDRLGGAMRCVTMRQVHGSCVTAVDEKDGSDAGEVDGIVTQSSGIALGVLTADCVPILLVAPRQHVVGAVHAGWRGTVAGIAPLAVAHIEKTFHVPPAEIRAALGPSIGNCCYEVDRDVVDELAARWGVLAGAVIRGAGTKMRLDLRRANATLLARAGVPASSIASVGPCTKCTVAEYFSYRGLGAATGRSATGRQLSFIGWQD